MQRSGVDARCQKSETEEELVLTISIPKRANESSPEPMRQGIGEPGDPAYSEMVGAAVLSR